MPTIKNGRVYGQLHMEPIGRNEKGECIRPCPHKRSTRKYTGKWDDFGNPAYVARVNCVGDKDCKNCQHCYTTNRSQVLCCYPMAGWQYRQFLKKF